MGLDTGLQPGYGHLSPGAKTRILMAGRNILALIGTANAALLVQVVLLAIGVITGCKMIQERNELAIWPLIAMLGVGGLGLLGLTMILAGDIEVVRRIIVMAALPFVVVLPLLFVSLLKALKSEKLS